MPVVKLPHRVKQNENDIALLWDETQRLRRRIENMWGQVVDQSMYGNWLYAQSAIMALPGLVGFWPMSVFDSSGNPQDVSGHGHHLTLNGNLTFNQDGFLPYADFDGTGDYFSRADEADFDIAGDESHVGIPGLTMGGLWYGKGAVRQVLMAKYDDGSSESYRLTIEGDVRAVFYISDDGADVDSVKLDTSVKDAWHLIVGRFDDAQTGEELKIWVDDGTATDSTSIASIFDSTADFTIGADDGGTVPLTGYASLCFLCAAAVSDDAINELYRILSPLF